MRQHHIKNNAKSFFEGWYFKHQIGGRMIAFIPGVSINRAGEAAAFLQVVTEGESHNLPYRFDQLEASDDLLEVRLGDSVFSETGVRLKVDTPEFHCTGSLEYGPLLPPRGDIMGPFALLPAMECNHGVISLYHTLRGSLEIQGERVDFTGGRGYMEKDWGRSFPKGYTWFQCNDFPGEAPVSVMAAVADVPVGPGTIRGVIASVYVDGQEHRLATYNGGRVLTCDEGEISLKRGREQLTIRLKEGWGKPLHAPDMGEMTRIIRERPACQATVTYTRGDQVLLDRTSKYASYESAWQDAQ